MKSRYCFCASSVASDLSFELVIGNLVTVVGEQGLIAMGTAFGDFDSESFNDGDGDDRGRELAEYRYDFPLGICPRADVKLPCVLAPFSWLFAPLLDGTIL